MNLSSNRILGAPFATLFVGMLTAMVAIPSESFGQASVPTIITYDGITPMTITQPMLNSIINSMIAGNPSAGAWTYVPNGSVVNVSQVLSHNGVGNGMNYGVVITDTTPFTLAQIQWSLTGFYTPLSGTFGSSGLTYDLFGIGINYGPDGIPGTADDIVYTTGNANTPVNAVYLLGMDYTFDTGGLSVNNALNAWSSFCPQTETETYTVDGTSQTDSITYIVVGSGFSGGPTNVFVTQTVTLMDASTGSITNWVWNFGDGHSVTNTSNANVSHAYAAAGSYTVSLTVAGTGGSNTNTQANYVVVKPKAVIGGVTLAGGKLVFRGTNEPAGAQYRILTTTNVSLALAGWTPVWTNVFAADGSFSYTNTPGVNPAGFFLLVSP